MDVKVLEAEGRTERKRTKRKRTKKQKASKAESPDAGWSKTSLIGLLLSLLLLQNLTGSNTRKVRDRHHRR